MTNREQSPIDLPIIRYATVVIGLAEALNEQGKTDEAIEWLNKVRQRAGVALLNSNTATMVQGQEDMRVRIQNEFRWETAGEGVDFYEELRWKTWKESKFNNADGTALGERCMGDYHLSLHMGRRPILCMANPKT